MTDRVCAVAVKQLPESLSAQQGRLFFMELESSMKVDRPCIVLDFSKLRRMDRSSVYLLLCCLEAAMKRTGDIKLAAIPAEAKEILRLTGVDPLFESFATNAEAVNSFGRRPIDPALNVNVPRSAHEGSQNAA